MKQHKLHQGSPEWHEHRAMFFNASDAPAVLGCSPYTTRDKLIHEKATGIRDEVDAGTQKRFDDGHLFERLARQIAEQIIGEELYPVTGTLDKYSASFDGLTMLGDIDFEHKSLNKELAEILVNSDIDGADLPKHYRVQMEQQLMVSSAEKALFMASKFIKCTHETEYFIDIFNDAGELIGRDYYELVDERHCWYYPDSALRAEIVAGWDQFETDLAEHKTKLANGEIKQTVQAQAEVLLDLPAITYKMNGLALTSDLEKFKEQARLLIKKSREPLVTDDDFATAESLVKVFKSAEDKLAVLSEQVIGEVSDIDAFIKELKQVSEGMRQARLATNKKVTSEKERRRQEIINKAQHDLNNYIQAQQAKLEGYALPAYNADFAGAMKGKQLIESLQSAANDCLANAKIAISQQADEGAANLKAFNELAVDHKFLFADLQQNLFKPADDFTAMVKSRIADHKEEERIRAEKAAERTVEPAKQPEPEPEELPLAAETTSQPTLKQQVNAVMDNKKPGGKLSGIVNADLLDAEINSIVRYMTDERYPLSHLKAIASIVYAFNESEESEKEVFAFADSIKKKYGVAA